jgi:hypothetical protein
LPEKKEKTHAYDIRMHMVVSKIQTGATCEFNMKVWVKKGYAYHTLLERGGWLTDSEEVINSYYQFVSYLCNILCNK